jgi:glycine hydroxymethyltransferase
VHASKISKIVFPGVQGTPSLNLLAAKAVCFHLASKPAFRDQQKRILENAAAFAAGFKKKGYRIVTGGTDNHLVLVDLRSKGLTGAVAEKALESVGIIVNRNVIPGDPQKPDISSGIRIGSPAITVRGMGTPDVSQIVNLMDTAMLNIENKEILGQVSQEVADLCRKFPVYKE